MPVRAGLGLGGRGRAEGSAPSLDNWGGPYGGWAEGHIRQHVGDVDLCGIHVDLDICRG